MSPRFALVLVLCWFPSAIRAIPLFVAKTVKSQNAHTSLVDTLLNILLLNTHMQLPLSFLPFCRSLQILAFSVEEVYQGFCLAFGNPPVIPK